MVNWYDPKQLAFTAVKTVISAIFGNFADRREIQAALDPSMEYHDFSGRPEIWIVFISDLGDGFDATYTMAHLMAKESLEWDGQSLPRGNILVMGGDEVYPTPELMEYNNRLKGPYNAAFPWKEGDVDRPSLFALPGNHDWYDGLTNFLRLFCQGRSLGNWHSKQKRSYFAIKLPHHYWLLGIDIQLNADIDYPQLCYFKEIAKKELAAKDKIILCVAEPSWVYQSFDKKNNSHDRLKFFIDKILFGKEDDFYDQKNRDINLVAVLTGDLHHYSRYEETQINQQKCQLITAGGGGAFMHPTHTLKKTITSGKGYNAQLKKVFPSVNSSRILSLNNLIFPWYSLTMILFFGFLHLFTTWILQVGNLGTGNFLGTVAGYSPVGGQFGEVFIFIQENILINPSLLSLNLLLFVGIVLFTDTTSGRGKWNYIAGVLHASLHICNLYLLIWFFSWFNGSTLALEEGSLDFILVFSAEMIFLGGIATTILFGIYLLVSITLLDNHITEASSSFRWEGYKDFLRIHLTADQMTIYPIGVEKIVKNWKNRGSKEKPHFEGRPIHFSMIENPIVQSEKKPKTDSNI